MNLIKFGRMHVILRKHSKDFDEDKKPSRYRRRFFSRSGRRQQYLKPGVASDTPARYRRRVSSRAGRRNRAAAQVRKRCDSDFGFESDTDSQTTLTCDGIDEGEEVKCPTLCNYDCNLCESKTHRIPLLPKVIKIEANSNVCHNEDNKNSSNLLDPTASSYNKAEFEGENRFHQFDVIPLTPQLVVSVRTDAKNDLEQHTMTDDIHTSDKLTTAVYSAEESLQQLLVGGNQKIRSKVVELPPLTRQPSSASFMKFRVNYLIVYAAIMLADGLQGTHLYALYSGYGYTVANLYSIGFITGAITSPFTGPIVDRFGRKKSAMFYCFFEILINITEQYENFTGLIISRMAGGITTNLLSSVFESWLATEHRRRKFDGDSCEDEPRLNLVMRDSTIVSKLAAIASGYIAHFLAGRSGNAGPFGGAVFFTCIALAVVWFLWTENYGDTCGRNDGDVINCDTNNEECSKEVTTFKEHMFGAFQTIVGDSTISRIGLIEGLTEGALQTFVFFWSPALKSFALSAPQTALGMGENSEPAYGLIFGGFMACGVVGGVVQPYVHKNVTISAWTSHEVEKNINQRAGDENAMQTGILCSLCYILTAMLFLIPCIVDPHSTYAFSISLIAFFLYELLVGIYLPCQGVIRSIFMPKESTCSVMTMLRVIVNVAVALGVISTNYVSFTSTFVALSVMMVVAAILQLSIVWERRAV